MGRLRSLEKMTFKKAIFLTVLSKIVAEKKAETPVCTLPAVDDKALANTMADRLAGVKAVKVGELLTDVKVAAPA